MRREKNEIYGLSEKRDCQDRTYLRRGFSPYFMHWEHGFYILSIKLPAVFATFIFGIRNQLLLAWDFNH